MNPSIGSRSQLLLAYLQEIRSRDVQSKTVDRHQLCLNIFLDYLDHHGGFDRFRSISLSDICDFTIAYATDHGVDCRRHMHTMLRSFLRFAYQQYLIAQDLSAAVPAIRIYRLSRAPRPISEQAVGIIIDAIDSHSETGCRDLAVIQLLRIYGVRAVQLQRLSLTDVDWRNDTIQFPPAKHGHPITVPLFPEAGNALSTYLTRFRKHHIGYQEMFLTATSPPRPLQASTISGSIRRRINIANVNLSPGVKPGSHTFRYACVTRMLKANCSLKVVADTLGHRRFDSVQFYNKLDTDALRSLALPWPEVAS